MSATLTAAVLASTVSLGAGHIELPQSCILDSHPAATLLLPYFEVDVDDPEGATTLISVHNSWSQGTLTRVVLWTDMAVPTFGFDLYLTGFDVQTLNLRDVFKGRLPITGIEISPIGNLSDEPDSIFRDCDRPPPEVPVDFLRDAHAGRPTAGGLCAGTASSDGLLRGYVTIDVTKRCTDLVPSDPGYFDVHGVAARHNVLWGDAFHLEPGENNARGDSLVALQADHRKLEPGDLTFYGRYTGGDASDGREPLPTVWASRHLTGAGLDARSTLTVWRDVGGAAAPFPCDAPPAWFPLGQNAIYSFDEQENAVLLEGLGPLPPTLFPAATQRRELITPFDFGTSHLDLNPTPYSRAQAFVAGTVSADGRFSIDRRGTPLDTGCDLTGCTFGEATAIDHLCLSNADDPGADLGVGDVPRFVVQPLGCYSSSCTRVFRADCRATRHGEELRIDAAFCLRDIGVHGCTPDCGGAGDARCTLGEPLEAGDYTVTVDDLSLAFSVPADLGPRGRLCVTREP